MAAEDAMSRTAITRKELSKVDLRRLAPFPSDAFEFTKTVAEERFAFDMFRVGLLERRWEMYSMAPGGKSAQFRWSYRLTDMGRAALGEPVSG
jgi:hypothetical protein